MCQGFLYQFLAPVSNRQRTTRIAVRHRSDFSGLGSNQCDNLPAMVSPSTEDARFNWRTQAYAAFAALVFFAAISVFQADISLVLYLFLIAVLFVSGITLVVYAAISKKHRRRSLRQLTTVAIVSAVAVALFAFGLAHPVAIRTAVRWMIGSSAHKAQVLAQAPPQNGEFQHIDWDGWGMFAQDTTVYLVFDPIDALSAAARSHQPGEFNGIPCKVQRVSRLESHWYTVLFYTDETWGHCN